MHTTLRTEQGRGRVPLSNRDYGSHPCVFRSHIVCSSIVRETWLHALCLLSLCHRISIVFCFVVTFPQIVSPLSIMVCSVWVIPPTLCSMRLLVVCMFA